MQDRIHHDRIARHPFDDAGTHGNDVPRDFRSGNVRQRDRGRRLPVPTGQQIDAVDAAGPDGQQHLALARHGYGSVVVQPQNDFAADAVQAQCPHGLLHDFLRPFSPSR